MSDAKTTSALSRRRLFAGAGTVGALAAAATVLPLKPAAPPVAAAPQPPVDPEAGYQLTEHVQHYYRTARV